MGKKSREKQSARSNPRPTPGGITPASPSQNVRPPSKHRWLLRLAACVLIPALLLGLSELALRLGGYGYPTSFFVDASDGKMLTTNQKFGWQFYSRAKATSPTPLLFAKQKAPGTLRVFVLGESAAAGTPDPAFGFSRQLELMLREQYPSNRFEMLNAAMRGIDSHIVRQIAAECAGLSPDLFIIYMGNNEMIGLHSPSPESSRWSANVRWLRFRHAIRHTKLAQFAGALGKRLAKSRPPEEQTMEFFRRQRLAFDDPRREPVYQNFAINLRDICGFAESAGARAIVCSVGVNQRDFPPLGSLHRRDWNAAQQQEWEQRFAAGTAAESRRDFASALTSYEHAAQLDDHFAELLFRMARCHEALSQMADARRFYALACDWDAIQFRTDSRLNATTRRVATNCSSRVRFVDVEDSFAACPLSEAGVPDGRIFHEHVHLKFDGDHHLATVLLPQVAGALSLPASARPPLTREECARRLSCTRIDESNMKAAIARLTSNPPFLDQLEHAARQAAADAQVQKELGQVSREEVEQTIASYRQAMRARPDDWMLHLNLANLLNQMKQSREAAAEFAEVVKRLPPQRTFCVAYGNVLLQAGRAREAAEQFEAALKIDSEYPPAQLGLKAARSRLR